MSVEVDCPTCGAEYDARHGKCPVCTYQARVGASPAAEVCPKCGHRRDDKERRGRGFCVWGCGCACVFPPAPEQKPTCEWCAKGIPLNGEYLHDLTPHLAADQTHHFKKCAAPSVQSEPPERIWLLKKVIAAVGMEQFDVPSHLRPQAVEYARVHGPQEPTAPSHSLQQAARKAAEKWLDGECGRWECARNGAVEQLTAIIIEALGGGPEQPYCSKCYEIDRILKKGIPECVFGNYPKQTAQMAVHAYKKETSWLTPNSAPVSATPQEGEGADG